MYEKHFFTHWRILPAVWLSLFLILGILLGLFWPYKFIGGLLLGFGLLGSILSSLPQKRIVTLRPLGRALSLVFFMLGCGHFLYLLSHTKPPNHLAHLLQNTSPSALASLRVSGKVQDFPVQTRWGLRFMVAAETVEVGNATLPATGKLLVFFSKPKEATSLPDLQWGDTVKLTGVLRPPRSKRNPSDFDYAQYLYHKQVYTTLSVWQAQGLEVSDRAEGGLTSFINTLRAYIYQTLEGMGTTAETRAMLQALVLGDRSDLDETQEVQFQRTGLTHLLAVSGLHVTLIGMLLFQLLRPILGRFRRFSWRQIEAIRLIVTMAILLVFLLITGAGASVARAVLMAGLLLWGIIAQRKTSGFNSLGVAAVLLLLWNPNTLFDVGFQLSFGAVGGIFLFQPLLNHFVQRYELPEEGWQAVLYRAISVSLFATLGTMPVTLYHFGQVAVSGIFLNLIGIPLSNVALVAALLALLTDFWSPFLGATFGASADFCTQLFMAFVAWSATQFGAFRLEQYVDNLWFIGALVAVLMGLVLWPFARLRWRWFLMGGGLATMGIWATLFTTDLSPKLDVLFFDVGQGDAALLKLPNGKTLLLDAGNRDDFRDAGLSTIYPHLRRKGLDKVDLVLISHPHNDHIGGLPSLLHEGKVKEVGLNGQPYAADGYQDSRRLADRLGIPFRTVLQGNEILLDPNVSIRILSPTALPDSLADVNTASLVVVVRYGETRFLFMGDASASTEAALLDHPDLVPMDVVKVGHHGSRTSSIAPFIAQVQNPARTPYAVVSVAKPNRYGLPDEEVLARWQQAGFRIHQTSANRALWLQSDGYQVKTVDWR